MGRCGVVVGYVAVENVGEYEGGGAVADNDCVDMTWDKLGGHGEADVIFVWSCCCW